MDKKIKKNEDKDILFINTTKLTEEEVTNLQLFTLKKYNLLISIMIAVFFGGIGIGLCFVNTYVGVAILLAGIIGGLFLFPYVTKEQIKRQNNQIFANQDYINSFEFYNDYINIKNIDKNNEKEISQNFNYSGLYKVVEFSQFVYIFINKNQSFMLDKKGMTKGTIGEVIELLKENGLKYQDKRYLGDYKDKKRK